MELTAVEIFCSYSHVDEPHRQRFNPHVENLKRNEFIQYWHDREIPAGSDWKAEINQHLNSADIITWIELLPGDRAKTCARASGQQRNSGNPHSGPAV